MRLGDLASLCVGSGCLSGVLGCAGLNSHPSSTQQGRARGCRFTALFADGASQPLNLKVPRNTRMKTHESQNPQ
eukprot:2853199-Pyramimonas_sp.AAC.1